MGILDLMNGIEAAGDRGRQRGQQTALGRLYSQAATAPREQRSGLLAQMGAISPQASFDAESHFGQMDDNARKQLGRYAAAFSALPADQKAAAYPQLAEMGRSLGLPVPQGGYQPDYDAGIAQLGQALGGTGATSEVQTFNAFAKGLNADDVAKARRIQLGLDPRASSAAIGYKVVKGNDGVERLVAVDPREVGSQVIGSGETYGSGVGGTSGSDLFASLPAGLQITSGQRTPAHNAEVGGVPNSYHLTDQARDIVPRNPQEAAAVQQWAAQNGMEVINEGDHLHVEPRGNAPHVNPFASRTPEADAAAVEAAKQRAQLDALPERGRLEATNAGLSAGAQVTAKSAAEAQAGLPKVEQNANLMLTAIRDLKADPALKSVVGLNGKFNPKVYIPGTPEQRALARIRQIQGQTFLQAYQTLRGGGQITEVEGQKAEAALARLDRAQSYDDYIGALNDLESVIGGAVSTARRQAGNTQSAPQSGPRVIRYDAQGNRI